MEGEADVMDTSERLFTSTDIEDRAQMDNNKDKVQLNIRYKGVDIEKYE